jgi:hypothetical protein
MTYPENISDLPVGERDPEAPVEDAIEQATPADPGGADGDPEISIDIEAPEWDALEQARTVEGDDDYR